MAGDTTCRSEQTLGELGEFRNGANFSQDDYGPGYPIVNVKQLYRGRYASMDDLHELSAAAVSNAASLFLRYGDILFARSSVKASGAGQAAMVGPCRRNAVFSGFIIRFRVTATDRVAPEFLNYLLRSPIYRELLTRIGSGTTITNLSQDTLAGLPIELPALAEQKAIAAVLGALDDKIELNRRMNATLEAMARALFQSWFVDFDPVRAKLDGRPPAALDPATAALFPDHLEDSPIGHIPEGWKVGSVVEGFNLTMGQSPPGETYNEEGNGSPFYQGRTDFGFRFPTRRTYCSAPSRYAHAGDTLVSVRAPVGDINMASEECCIGRGVAAVRHKSGASSFTYHSMANLYPEFARFEAEGTVFGSINKAAFQKLRVVIPPPEIVAAYERQAGPFDEQIRTFENQSHTLATLRDTLLPKLLSGEMSTLGIAPETLDYAQEGQGR